MASIAPPLIKYKFLKKILRNLYQHTENKDIQDIFKEYQSEIICKKTDKKNQEVIVFCYKNDFLKNKKYLIKSHKFIKDKETGKLNLRNFGIPQGDIH